MKLFQVLYSTGWGGDVHYNYCFVTDNEQLAKDWVEKFNRILNKWKAIHRLYGMDGYRMGTNLPEFVFERFYQIMDINEASYTELAFRTIK